MPDFRYAVALPAAISQMHLQMLAHGHAGQAAKAAHCIEIAGLALVEAEWIALEIVLLQTAESITHLAILASSKRSAAPAGLCAT